MSTLNPAIVFPLGPAHRELLVRACRIHAKRLRRHARDTAVPEADREVYAATARRASTLAAAGSEALALVVATDTPPAPRDEIDLVVSEALALRAAADAGDHADEVRTLATLAHLVGELTRSTMSQEEQETVCPDDTYREGGRVVRWVAHERSEEAA